MSSARTPRRSTPPRAPRTPHVAGRRTASGGHRSRGRHRPPQGGHRQGPYPPRLGPVDDQRPDARRVLPEQGAPAARQRAVRDPGARRTSFDGRGPDHRRRPSPGRRGAPAPRRDQGADPGGPGKPPGAEEGRLPDQGPPGQGAQEVRPEEGPQGAAVTPSGKCRPRGACRACAHEPRRIRTRTNSPRTPAGQGAGEVGGERSENG